MRLRKGIFHKKEIYILGVVAIIVVAIGAGLPIMLGGNTVTTGANPGAEQADALSCEGEGIKYPKLPLYDGVTDEKVSIRAIYSANKLDSISLYYEMEFRVAATMRATQAEIEMDMNRQLEVKGLNSEKGIEATISQNGNSAVVGLYSDDYTDDMGEFFMVDGVTANVTKRGLAEALNRAGLECRI